MFSDPRTTRRFGLFAALLMAALQLVVAAHALEEEHASECETCQVCVLGERLEDGTPALDAPLSCEHVSGAGATASLATAPDADKTPPRSRGPPTH